MGHCGVMSGVGWIWLISRVDDQIVVRRNADPNVSFNVDPHFILFRMPQNHAGRGDVCKQHLDSLTAKFSSVCQDDMYLLRQLWYSQDCLACWANLADLEAPFSPCRYFRWPQDVRPSTVLAINIRNMWKIFHDQACKGYLLFVSKDDTGFRVRPRWPKLVHLAPLDLERWTSVLEGGGLHCGICRSIGRLPSILSQLGLERGRYDHNYLFLIIFSSSKSWRF